MRGEKIRTGKNSLFLPEQYTVISSCNFCPPSPSLNATSNYINIFKITDKEESRIGHILRNRKRFHPHQPAGVIPRVPTFSLFAQSSKYSGSPAQGGTCLVTNGSEEWRDSHASFCFSKWSWESLSPRLF